MTTREVTIAGVVLLVLLIVLGAVNYYVVKPALTPLVPPNPEMAATESGSTAVDRNIVAATLEMIKAAQGSGEAPPFEPRATERNPFFWPGELAAKRRAALQSQQVVAEPTSRPEQPVVDEWLESAVVSMILVGKNRRMAVLNSEFVYEGSVVDEHKIVKIEKDALMVQGPTGVERLAIGEINYAYMQELREAAAAEKQEVGTPSDQAMQQAVQAGMAGMPAVPTAAQQEAVERLMERLAPLMGGQ